MPDSATQLPMVNPATPTSRYWASDTMPTELDRNTIDDAATPRISVRVRAKLTKKSVPISGITRSRATAATTTGCGSSAATMRRAAHWRTLIRCFVADSVAVRQ